MSEESVGKISLDLEIKSDIGKQVASVSNLIGKNLKTSLNSGMATMFDNVKQSSTKSVNALNSSMKSSLSAMKQNISRTMKSLFISMKNAKVPTIDFPKMDFAKPKEVNAPKANALRGPPVIDQSAIAAKIENVSASLDITNAKIEQQTAKLAMLKEEYANCFSVNRKNKLQEQILKTEGSINSLVGKSDKLGFELNDLDAKFAKAGLGAKEFSNKVNASSGATNRASNSMNNLKNTAKKTNESLKSHSSNIGIIVRSMFTWGIVFPLVLRGLTAIATTIGQGLMANKEFANSFNQIKTNMSVAFTPILNAILPALNTLMSALARATTYMASFISNIFGKTYKQSYQATQQLIDAKVAMGAYGDSAKKAAKDVRGLAAIDEINTLAKTNENMGGGVNDKIPTLVAPPLDTSAVDASMKALVDRIKGFFGSINFTPLKNSFENLKKSIVPIVDNVGKVLKWFMDNILKPLTVWVIEDALPAWFNYLSSVLKVINPILEVFMNLGKWLWDEFLRPIASWTGGLLIASLNLTAECLDRIANWITNNKPIVESLVIVLGSFALAWGIVTGVVGIANLVIKGWAIVSGIAASATYILGGAIAFLTSPITIAIAAIGAVIAIGVLLYKHWDFVKAKAIEVWDGIKAKFAEFKEWLGGVFTTDWSQRFGFIGDVLNGFLVNAKNMWNSTKQIFSGIIDFIAGVFTGNWERAWKGVVNIFGGIMSSLASVVKQPLNAVISLINGAITGLNKISIDIPDWVPGIGGKGFGVNIPKIPYLAKGGIIDSPTLAMVGERGKEAVMPLENNTGWIADLATKIATLLGVNNNNVGAEKEGGDIVFMFDGSIIGKIAIKELRKMQRQGGIMAIPF